MAEAPHSAYGLSVELFVTRKASGEAIVIGGMGTGVSRWVRILSLRAAHLLWMGLAQALYPETALAESIRPATSPLRNLNLPSVTSHIQVEQIEEGGVMILGWVETKTWQVMLNRSEAEKFWDALNKALYAPQISPEKPASP